MRIIAGSHRGRVLRPPKGLDLRPTTDLAKESLFNILNNHFDFEQLRVLDLFAGTGNISLEFASRGAASVTAVEKNPRCTAYILQTASSLGFDNMRVLRTDVFQLLKKETGPFDLIFADPPYAMNGRENLPALVLEGSLLAPQGWFVMEHDSFVGFKSHPLFVSERVYGKVHFSIFNRELA